MSARSRFAHCPSKYCLVRTRHYEAITTTHSGFYGIVHGWCCDNCGRMKIANNMRVRKPEADEGRWATKGEIAAMRKADRDEFQPLKGQSS